MPSHGVQESPNRERVHAAVPAEDIVAVVLPDGMVVFFVEGLDGIPFVLQIGISRDVDDLLVGADAVDVDSLGVVEPDALGSLNPLVAGVGAGE